MVLAALMMSYYDSKPLPPFADILYIVLKDSIPDSGLTQVVADNVDALTQVSTDNCMSGTENTIKCKRKRT